MKKLNFSKKEWCLLGVSLTAVTVSNVIGGEIDFLTLAATWVGIFSLLLAAKVGIREPNA